jgi:methyl-accepting chemotaxis protein
MLNRRTALSSGALLALAGMAPARAQAPAAALTADSHLVLSACRALVEEHLGGILRAAKAVAATSDARSGRWDRVRPALAELSADTPSAAAVWFAQPDGSYDTVQAGLIRQNLKDRAYFPGLMAGETVEDALVLSKSTGQHSIVVAAPVKRSGKVIGAIGVSVKALFVSELMDNRVGLPADLVFYALDAKGQTALHRDPARMGVYPSDLGEPSLKAAVATILSQEKGRVEYDFEGKRRIALFDRSPFTGWTFVLASIRG